MLGLLEERGVHCTCFVLGEVAEAFPNLVKRIHEQGHELGVHGWHHHRVFEQERTVYGESLRRARALLQDLSGQEVLGYRAVAMSITKATWWAYDAISQAGFRYSSSIYPFRGTRYGVPEASPGAHRVTVGSGGELLEIPLSVVQLGPLRLPALGGGYFRHLPYAYSRWALARLEREQRPAVIYLHPYELDSQFSFWCMPIDLSRAEEHAIRRVFRSQLRNREQTEGKLGKLLAEARCSTIHQVFGPMLP
ncbi:MAG: DUF3473 domain-containing protein [bacterium]|nr:DUF3473 domain-containing protein [bacterium]